MSWKWKCPVCGKEFENPTILDFYNFPKVIMYGYFKVNDQSKDSMKAKSVCSKECVEHYKDKFFVEVYKGKQIYCIDGRYIPYWGCSYYFKDIEDVKGCIDKGVNRFTSVKNYQNFISM